MLIDSKIIEERYERFVEKVVETGVVYTLKDKKGVAVCPSNHFFYDEAEEEACPTLLFWSEEKRAQLCQAEEWAKHRVEQIPLAEFMELWCLGMYDDGVVVGLDFDHNLFGYEQLPIDLVTDLIRQAEAAKTRFSFRNFKSLADLKTYLEEIEEE
ncbi:DUF2750 domain-containing protein [Capnocytophaga sp.]|uniref:DUF2750 domain-containing protein n=1 Tax=Capnocytophaga sp. TaxID=44737 RepID=UPI0026DC436D|nr:DUF2750 domain-containing protein [Capnocytophaga sp.]MDO5105832.1 DUF2750 domain-containing protein [Capnocytophaga sp.]